MIRKSPIAPRVSGLLHGGDYNPDQWLDRPDILEEDIRLMQLAGVNEATVGIFSWSRLQPAEDTWDFAWLDRILDRLGEAGIHVMLATPSGARPAWMDRAYPEVLRTGPDRVRRLHGERHNHCMSSPEYRRMVREMNTKLAERYGQHPAVILWHVSNEYSGECHCDLCQEAFRDWLRDRYDNDIENLNHAWWTSFWSHRFTDFDEIESPAPHGERSLHGLNLDWKRFTTWNTVQFFLEEIRPLRSLTPHIPVTTNFMGPNPTLDYWAFADHLDVVSNDIYPDWHNRDQKVWETAAEAAFTHDLIRTMKGGRPWILMESTPSLVNHKAVNRPKRPGLHVLSSLQAVAHGSDTVQYFQWRKSRGSSEKFHGAVVDHVGHEHTRVFGEVAEVGRILPRLEDVAGTHTYAQVAVMYDWENRWAIEDLQGLSRDRDYEAVCREHHRAFWRLGVSVDVINEDCDFSRYRLIVAPMLYLLRPGVADRLKTFVKEGGTLVTTYLTGYVNVSDLCYLGGVPGDGLMDLTGIWAEEMDALYPDESKTVEIGANPFGLSGKARAHQYCEVVHARGAEVLATFKDDYYAGHPAITRNRVEAGQSIHLATRLDEKTLASLYEALVHAQNIPTALGARLPKGVSATTRSDGEYDYIFVMNFSQKEKAVPLPLVAMTDLLTGDALTGEVRIPPMGRCVLKAGRVDRYAPTR